MGESVPAILQRIPLQVTGGEIRLTHPQLAHLPTASRIRVLTASRVDFPQYKHKALRHGGYPCATLAKPPPATHRLLALLWPVTPFEVSPAHISVDESFFRRLGHSSQRSRASRMEPTCPHAEDWEQEYRQCLCG
jgi:hypothetical protein